MPPSSVVRAVFPLAMAAIVSMAVLSDGGKALRLPWRDVLIALATLDDLVEFAAIEPYTSALRAVVDLDVLSGGHRKLRLWAYRALHV